MAVGLKDIETALSGILLPQPKRSLPQLNMVRDIGVSEGSVKLTLALTVLSAAERERVQEWVRAAIEAIPGVKELAIELVEQPPQELNQFDRVIAVMSGKGGVGKSLVNCPARHRPHPSRASGGHPGCGYNRTQHTQDVWPEGSSHRE